MWGVAKQELVRNHIKTKLLKAEIMIVCIAIYYTNTKLLLLLTLLTHGSRQVGWSMCRRPGR
jgi:hypothetical protein